jgi:hypothetical protein
MQILQAPAVTNPQKSKSAARSLVPPMLLLL